MTYTLLHNDAIAALRELPDNSVDSLVCDPPSGISFMGKDWDHNLGHRDRWIEWLAAIMAECLRVLKPGGHALVWALPRTSHWTATAIEDAGFEVRDCITHVFGQGFSKAHLWDAPTAADWDRNPRQAQEDERMVECGWNGWANGGLKPSNEHWWLVRKPIAAATVAGNVLQWGTGALNVDGCRVGSTKNIPASASATRPSGFAMGANTEGTSGTNPNIGRWPPNLVLSHTDGCERVGVRRVKAAQGIRGRGGNVYGGGKGYTTDFGEVGQVVGYADADGLEQVEEYRCVDGCPIATLDGQGAAAGVHSAGAARRKDVESHYAASSYDMSGVRQMNRYDDNSANVSRFFPTFTPDYDAPFLYQAKASRRERNAGCEGLPANGRGSTIRGLDRQPYPVRVHDPDPATIAAYLREWRTRRGLTKNDIDRALGTVTLYSWYEGRPAGTELPTPEVWVKLKEIIGFDDTHDREMTETRMQEPAEPTFPDTEPMQNSHPTVKPIALMRWLVRLVTPPGGTVLDCFLGSGSTGVAAVLEGFDFIGIEREQEYLDIAQARIAHADGGVLEIERTVTRRVTVEETERTVVRVKARDLQLALWEDV